MLKVICSNSSCIYCNENDECDHTEIVLVNNECASVKEYLKQKEYQKEYYKRVRLADGNIGKALSRGKKIVINNVVFYTTDNQKNCGDEIELTDAETGLYVGTKLMLEKHFEDFKRAKDRFIGVSLDELPLAEYRDGYGYVLKE